MYFCKAGYVSRGGMRRFTCPYTGIWPINTLRCTRKSAPCAHSLPSLQFWTFGADNLPYHVPCVEGQQSCGGEGRLVKKQEGPRASPWEMRPRAVGTI